MSVSTRSSAPDFAWPDRWRVRLSMPARLRTLLLLGSALSIAVAAAIGHPEAFLAADPELATLLRGMAVIKAAIVAAAIGVLYWRFARPIAQPVALAYGAGAWLIAGATAMVWQLSWIPAAAIVFHGAGIGMLVVAWHEHRESVHPSRPNG